MVVAILFTIFACVFAIYMTGSFLIFADRHTERIDQIYAVIADIIAIVLILLWIFAK